MPLYEVRSSYTTTTIYRVEADGEQDARRKFEADEAVFVRDESDAGETEISEAIDPSDT